MTTPNASSDFAAREAWGLCLEELQTILYPQSFDTWLKPLVCKRFDGEEVLLHAQNNLTARWVEEHYLTTIRTTIKKLHRITPEVRVIANGQNGDKPTNLWQTPENSPETIIEPPPSTTNTTNHPQETDEIAPYSTATAINSDYVFDSFVVGHCNEVAFSAARTIAENPGRTPFNPLLIYGGVGIGKSHLLQAIANECQRNNRGRVAYVTSEQFTREFVAALGRKTTLQFSRRYRETDVLLVDDIQFFEGKERMQEEFFHTFNTLHGQGRQIVLASDRAPDQMQGLSDRLLSRIQWGLVTDIEPPDLETRTAICQTKARLGGIELDIDMAEFIASHVHENVRELEGVVKRVLFFVERFNRSLTRDVIEQAVEALRGGAEHIRRAGEDRGRPRRVDAMTIVDAVAEQAHMDRATILGKSRKAEIVQNRQMAMYLCKALTPLTFRAIAAEFGGRDHATVVHSCRKFTERCRRDPSLLWEAKLIAKKLGYPNADLNPGSSSTD